MYAVWSAFLGLPFKHSRYQNVLKRRHHRQHRSKTSAQIQGCALPGTRKTRVKALIPGSLVCKLQINFLWSPSSPKGNARSQQPLLSFLKALLRSSLSSRLPATALPQHKAADSGPESVTSLYHFWGGDAPLTPLCLTSSSQQADSRPLV